jgi:aryl-alcohol dehydrogenase-like predicted oxidoreductase
MKVETRRLGAAGPYISLVGLGCNNFGMKLDEQQSTAVVRAALDAGITHFDTAERYGGGKSEVFLGKALGKKRGDVVIATKVAPRPRDEPYRPGVLRQRVLEACEIALRRLDTDYIDILYQHYPDPEASVEEALQAMSELIAAGKVLHAACSNFSGEQIDEAARVSAERGAAKFIACQIHWNLLTRGEEEELVPALRRQEMGIVPYFPLESGLLTGKYRRDADFPEGSRLAAMPRFATRATDETFAYLEELSRFAEARGHSLLELAFGWLAAQDGVASVIAGATTPEQVAENVRAGGAWRLSEEDLRELPRMYPEAF